MTFISLVLIASASLLAVLALILLLEVLAALPAPKEKPLESVDLIANNNTMKRAAIIVPAHNEGVGIIPTLDDIKPQLHLGDRLLVVADNCSDNTATVAAACGAEVIERSEPEKLGKGYALDWALRHLKSNPPDFIVFIDADCRIQSDMIGRLKDICGKLHRPVQATFLMTTATDSPVDHRVAEFAWVVKNWVRPLGLRYLNCPIQLMGTGMIFPWDVIEPISLASENLVEDMKLGLDLAAIGKAPRFYPFVIGTSYFPTSAGAAYNQRQRWEHGHIRMILMAPKYLLLALTHLNVELLVLTLDMTVPPLALLGMLIVGASALTGLAVLIGTPPAALMISATAFLAYMLAVFLAWLKFGRSILPLRSFLRIGTYVLGKFRLYCEVFSGKAVEKWVRTDRAAPK